MGLFHHKKDISVQTIRRLPQYLRIFYNLHAYGRELVSSTALAEETHLLPIVIKKDLQAVGAPSKLRAGFKVAGTIAVIEKFLGWNNLNKAFLVGAGHLGAALLGAVLLVPALAPLFQVAPLSRGLLGSVVGLSFGSMAVQAMLKTEWAMAMPAMFGCSWRIAGSNAACTIQKTASITATPMTLNSKCTAAARLAFLLAPTEEIMAVTQVPIFCPMMMGIAAP